ncbi:hypothetical protein [Clostridium septicum]|uniref:Uncharacterized protein n=1 Tax=Clostridium septicum TaxID=1504 RepID=A0A9N7JNB1_CLOSE|nr:hypothetical protein [Clostridium septicum]AYE34777.1 hypothetical protein CP523_10385 [Clostridium septicum]MDU1312721.1 hypothetical protein [Clostridium septicum]QAS60173.1 hypothetical protein EI377_05155 [Clostridium septicum]UEC20577.1 hypothetical protein LK444_14445 [Clostridium septicum]USS01370.1 hypothetical protein NH397_02730 [Clostridium septicum]
MKKFAAILNKTINILLIFFVVFLILNEYYIVEFSKTLRNVFAFLTFILILISAMKELLTNKSGLSRFINGIILFCSIIGGVFSVISNQLNLFIYICILFSVSYGFIDLVYKKS